MLVVGLQGMEGRSLTCPHTGSATCPAPAVAPQGRHSFLDSICPEGALRSHLSTERGCPLYVP